VPALLSTGFSFLPTFTRNAFLPRNLGHRDNPRISVRFENAQGTGPSSCPFSLPSAPSPQKKTRAAKYFGRKQDRDPASVIPITLSGSSEAKLYTMMIPEPHSCRSPPPGIFEAVGEAACDETLGPRSTEPWGAGKLGKVPDNPGKRFPETA